VLVHTPQGLRGYAGFHYSTNAKKSAGSNVLVALTAFDQAQSIVDLFHAREVDEGRIWQHPKLKVDSSGRVYHRLLSSLRKLDEWLRGDEGGLTKQTSHALIGKFVYLRYLRDRNILSDDRLALWDLKEGDIFGRKATKDGLEKLTSELDAWLNGDVFPVSWRSKDAPKARHIQRVAATFAGDQFAGDMSQLHLGFKAYDFSYIPIETLSLVYEQFLHTGDGKEPVDRPEDAGAPPKTKGRQEGAYYTPLPLVNYMLTEMERRHPLREGMKVFDPSCGSGAFLVQAYRRLIEKTFPMTKPKPKPSDLRELLRSSFFGCDVDGDACQVTQLSLHLTLLDYVTPPDLLRYPSFQLPSLGNNEKDGKKNIFEGNFFDIEPELRATLAGSRASEFDWRKDGFDWVIGNPPWKSIRPKALSEHDGPAWDWMRSNSDLRPVGLNQVAQAFAWEAPAYLAADGECGLLLPGMGLFEEPSERFRQKFFRAHQVHVVGNFANLAEVLFDGRSRVPAAALFYRGRRDGEPVQSDEPILVYSPFVVNQEATCPLAKGERGKLWSIVVNGSEMRNLELGEIIGGSGLPWKLAMWGTPWDERLVRRLERKWDTFRDLEVREVVRVAEGPQLRLTPKRRVIQDEDKGDDVLQDEEEDLENLSADKLAERQFERVDDLVGKPLFKTTALGRLRHVFSVPSQALTSNEKAYVCLIHGKSGLDICYPPHILVSAARNFAIYSNEYVIIEARQLGIISPTKDIAFLKALSLFLSSDFAFYHQFIRSTELGVKRDRATLEALRKMPIPLARLSPDDLREWSTLHHELAMCSPRPLDEEHAGPPVQRELFGESASTGVTPNELDRLLRKLNKMTADVLGLDERERTLVHDLVQVRYSLNDGKRGKAAMRCPTEEELRAYGRRLKQELDHFVGPQAERRHRVQLMKDDRSAMVEIDFTKDHRAAKEVLVLTADANESAALRKTRVGLLREHAQWVYFNRNLRLYRGRQTYVFKPMHRFHWVESMAMSDASEIIAETMAGASGR
jgi:hypothetical protein